MDALRVVGVGGHGCFEGGGVGVMDALRVVGWGVMKV